MFNKEETYKYEYILYSTRKEYDASMFHYVLLPFRYLYKGVLILVTGGKYGSFVEGKMCPKCHAVRIKIHKKCCRACYDKYFSR